MREAFVKIILVVYINIRGMTVDAVLVPELLLGDELDEEAAEDNGSPLFLAAAAAAAAVGPLILTAASAAAVVDVVVGLLSSDTSQAPRCR